MTPLKCKWFTGKGLIGIVMAQGSDGKFYYSIGTGDGLNEQIDINNIMAHGSRLPEAVGVALFGAAVQRVEKRSTSAKRVSRVAGKRPAKKSTVARSTGVKGKK